MNYGAEVTRRIIAEVLWKYRGSIVNDTRRDVLIETAQ